MRVNKKLSPGGGVIAIAAAAVVLIVVVSLTCETFNLEWFVGTLFCVVFPLSALLAGHLAPCAFPRLRTGVRVARRVYLLTPRNAFTRICTWGVLLVGALWGVSHLYTISLNFIPNGTRSLSVSSYLGRVSFGAGTRPPELILKEERIVSIHYAADRRASYEAARASFAPSTGFDPVRPFYWQWRGYTYPPGASGKLYRHVALRLPHWFLCVLLSFYPVIEYTRGYLRYRRMGVGLCENCRYNLTGNTSGVCPECGTPVENAPTPHGVVGDPHPDEQV